MRLRGVFWTEVQCGRFARGLAALVADRKRLGAVVDDELSTLLFEMVSVGDSWRTDSEKSTAATTTAACTEDFRSGEMVTSEAAGERLKITTRGVRFLAETGRLPGAQKGKGGRWVIPAVSVERYARRRAQENSDDDDEAA